MHSSRMHTACSSSCRGDLPQCMLGHTPPGCGPGTPPGCGPGDPHVWAWRPPQVWAWRPPWPDPSTSPLGVGLETCKACWDTTTPGDLLQGMLGYRLHLRLRAVNMGMQSLSRQQFTTKSSSIALLELYCMEYLLTQLVRAVDIYFWYT